MPKLSINIKFSLITLMLLLLSSQAYAKQLTSPGTQDNTKTPSTVKPDAETNQKTDAPPKPEIYNKDTPGISIGYTHNITTIFDIKNPNTGDPDYKTKARFHDSSNSPYLTITTGNLAPNDLNWQIVIEAGYSQFDLNTQELEDKKINYGTSIEGSHTYIMPQIFYSTSGIGVHPNKEHGFRLGGGLGIGLLQAKGTAVYTDKATRESPNPNEIHAVNISAAGIAMKLFAEYRYYGLFISTQAKIVLTNDSDEKNDKYVYSLAEAGLTLGYSVYF